MMSSLHRNQQSAADIKYHGLSNRGATCYLNSVLQVLFMTKDFREAVERCTHHNPDCIDHQLRDVFDELLERPSNTYKITKKLGIHTVYEQRDAAEYFEKILTLTSSDASQIFHGELTHKITCSHCREENNTDGRFWHLPLELVDSHSEVFRVVDGIDEYFRTSRLSGENQMYCDHCETKSDATITCAMKHHPDVLTLLLKRFDFDYRYMSYVKNNRVVVVPSSLQIPENQWYELYACVEHSGDLRGGHYTAKIKSQDDEKWYSFDDASVTLLINQPFQTGNTEKSQSSHLLFYKKKKTAYSNGLCQPANRGHVPDRKGCNKNRQDLGDQKEARKHEIDKRTMMKVEEEEGGKEAEAYASAEKRGLFSVGTQLVKREDDPKCERGKQKPVWNKPQKGFIPNRSEPEHKQEKEARNRSRDHPQVCVEELRDKERIDKKEKRKFFKRDAKDLKHEGLDKVDDDEGGKQGKGYAGQNKKRKDERMEKDNKGPAGDRKRDMWGSKLGRIRRWHERKKERRNVKRDEKRRRGGDEAAQRKRRSSAKGRFAEGSEDERRLGDGPEEKQERNRENQGDSSAGNEEWDRKSQRGSEAKNREKTPQDTSKYRESIERQSDPRPNERVTLTKGLSGINLNKSPSPEPQQRTAGNTQEESETDAAPQSRGDHAKKQNDTRLPGCFAFFSQNPVSE
ncbi:ubiquitin carboxyl-terminal hydrolase 13-like isoform X2 [Hippoglossus hippoglossus]|uniref:ubiquitin carboxyl-terminal hydrolase 13-like isoform X2 n=1 Tax=Hippoglossus hippoglossus TaxID=8267 RepID=UPI00148C5E97|nr:ubiquitin carboxyl-terminal hydrolase 13-like isoform X2 [Hippoglossus hippoglossus]XP_034471441.1 ubiquitin carboxyl-terminal hydrolase 13-like isoform X2 [Hippoglossus hippoglossus]